MKQFILIFLSFIILDFAHARNCSNFLGLQETENGISNTERFISIVTKLFDEGSLSLQYVESLADGDRKNPFDTLHTKSAQSVYKDIFDSYLSSDLDKGKISVWAIDFVKAHNEINVQKKEAQDETQSPYIKMRFYKIQSGEFIRSENRQEKRQPVKASIDYDFEMMSTKVTQKMWQDVMGSLPRDIEFKHPDLPITHVSWWSMLAFANQLSKNNGYEPYYKLEELTKKIPFIGDPAKGTFRPKGDVPEPNIFNAHLFIEEQIKNSVAHEKSGYRLPTDVEQEYVRSDRGRSKGDFFTNIDENNLESIAWYSESSSKPIYEVAQLNPQIIDNKPFYDLFGNKKELSQTGKVETAITGTFQYYYLYLRGGKTNSPIEHLKNNYNDYCLSYSGEDGNSFRLVRTLSK